MSKKYRPYSGTAGLDFQAQFCDVCEKDKEFRKTEKNGCEILLRALFFDIEDEKYPKEWIYDENGQPTCTAFEKEKI